jgi:exonuclease III
MIVSWNANGATSRAKNDGQIAAFMKEHKPDVLFAQEVQLAAADEKMRDLALKTEVASTLFVGNVNLGDHKRSLSLAPKKVAGTMTLVRKGIKHGDVLCSWHAVLSKLGAGPGVLKDFASEAHHPEGRVQYVSFSTFDCLHTYTCHVAGGMEGATNGILISQPFCARARS